MNEQAAARLGNDTGRNLVKTWQVLSHATQSNCIWVSPVNFLYYGHESVSLEAEKCNKGSDTRLYKRGRNIESLLFIVSRADTDRPE